MDFLWDGIKEALDLLTSGDHDVFVIVGVTLRMALWSTLLALLIGLLLGLIFIAADVEEFGHGRIGARADLDQVESNLLRLFEGFARIHYAQIFAIFVDHPHLRRLDELIVARAGHGRRRQRAARGGRWYSAIS